MGLPDGNTGFYKNDVGARSLGIYVGNIGQYGLIRKAILVECYAILRLNQMM